MISLVNSVYSTSLKNPPHWHLEHIPLALRTYPTGTLNTSPWQALSPCNRIQITS